MRVIGCYGISIWLIIWALCGQSLLAKENKTLLRVAVASNFRPTMQQLLKRFEQQTHYRAVMSSGSSGKLFAQISHGAPFDVFFSADQQQIQRLIQQPHLNIAGKTFTYALGQLVLVSRETPLPNLLSKQSLRQFMRRKNYFIALANPRFAPYGQAAAQVLASLTTVPQRQILTAENVAQAYQYVYAGHSDLGLVAKSLVLHDTSSNWSVIPQAWYHPILQDAIVLKTSAAALALAEFVQSPSAKKLIVANGYATLE